ncbi:MAG TPA: PIN domain-containing protein [Tetrasphaera sp.]|uniref:type II toxin-antitoxin system VapC family toxin n=1 Tax=Nostocoides sp. TaxID=1917966 RepID=UPI002C182BAB|nr:PIN domain-containing protein [Tetrasphaera sp.]HNQ07213.1 PIN domain-containing protein [Tetrasphaera sp.]
MPTAADPPALVVVDTNVLLAPTDGSRAHHRAATTFLRHDERRLAATPRIVREYLAVATRPVQVNGLGLDPADAVANVEEIQMISTMLGEGPATTTRLRDLFLDIPAVGKQVHDANVVACALAHGAYAIMTANVRDLVRYASLIVIEDLATPKRTSQ